MHLSSEPSFVILTLCNFTTTASETCWKNPGGNLTQDQYRPGTLNLNLPTYPSYAQKSRTGAFMNLESRRMDLHSHKSVGSIQPLNEQPRDWENEFVDAVLSNSANEFTGDTYKCHPCKRQFTTRNGLIRHIKCHKGIFKFFCDICGKGFHDRLSHEGHMNSHIDYRPYICELCQCSFSFQRSYIRHQITCRKRYGLGQENR